MTYSSDFRQRVVDACDRGNSTKEVAEMFKVAPSWGHRLKQWRRERGSVALRPCGGSGPKQGRKDHEVIHSHFVACADTTISALKAALQTNVSEVTTCRLGYRFRKKVDLRSHDLRQRLFFLTGHFRREVQFVYYRLLDGVQEFIRLCPDTLTEPPPTTGQNG